MSGAEWLNVIAIVLCVTSLTMSIFNLVQRRAALERRYRYDLEMAYLQGYEDAVFKRGCDRKRVQP